MPPAGFEPAIPASERPQTYALDRAPTGIGHMKIYFLNHLTLFNRKTSWLTMYKKTIAAYCKSDTEHTVTERERNAVDVGTTKS